MSAWNDVSRCAFHAPAAPPQFMLKLRYADARVCLFPLRYVAQSENCGCRCTCVVSMAGGAIQSVTENSGTLDCTEPRLLDRINPRGAAIPWLHLTHRVEEAPLAWSLTYARGGCWGAQEVQVGTPCEHLGLTGNGSHRPQKSRVAFSSTGSSTLRQAQQQQNRSTTNRRANTTRGPTIMAIPFDTTISVSNPEWACLRMRLTKL